MQNRFEIEISEIGKKRRIRKNIEVLSQYLNNEKDGIILDELSKLSEKELHNTFKFAIERKFENIKGGRKSRIDQIKQKFLFYPIFTENWYSEMRTIEEKFHLSTIYKALKILIL